MKMFKAKRILASLMASAIAAGTVSTISSFAASGPRIYVNVVYQDDNTIRADVMFENMPDLTGMGFHIQVGEGWDVVKKSSGNVDLSVIGCFTENANSKAFSYDNERHAVFFTAVNREENPFICNGKAFSFKLTKNSKYNSSNSAINLMDVPVDFLKRRVNGVDTSYYMETLESTPPMLEADEYIIGDADGDSVVNAMDASSVLMAIDKNPNISVVSIGKTFRNMFDGAKSPAAPDADQSGYINQKDADDIMKYYSTVATGGSYKGNIGKKDVYEIFDI